MFMVIKTEVFFGEPIISPPIDEQFKKAWGSGVRSGCGPTGLNPSEPFFHGSVFSRWAVMLGSVAK